jgi:hypothetical protein
MELGTELETGKINHNHVILKDGKYFIDGYEFFEDHYSPDIDIYTFNSNDKSVSDPIKDCQKWKKITDSY